MKTKVTFLGLLIAAAMMLSYIEALIPFYFAIPGIKLGLANAAILVTLYMYGWKEAFLVNVTRILLMGVLFGNIYSFLFSISGGILSMAVMATFLYSRKFSILGVSVAGGIFHNIGQIIFGVIFFRINEFLYYIPVLLLSGLITGALIGILLFEINRRVHFYRRESTGEKQNDSVFKRETN